MSMIKIYLWAPKQRLLVPKMAETDSGFFVEVEPLSMFECHDIIHWKKHILNALMKGMEVVETPDSAQEPGSMILDKLELNSWGEFEKQATLFTIHLGARYTTIYMTGEGEDGMWSHAAMTERKFHSKAPLEAIVDAIASDIIKHPKAMKPLPLLITSSGS